MRLRYEFCVDTFDADETCEVLFGLDVRISSFGREPDGTEVLRVSGLRMDDVREAADRLSVGYVDIIKHGTGR